jgi:hypothetical protein
MPRALSTRRSPASAYIFRGLLGIQSTTVLGIRAHNELGVPALSPDHEAVSFPIINLFYMRS